MGRPRKSAELQGKAVALALTGMPIARVANELGVGWATVNRWVKEAGHDLESMRAEKRYDFQTLVADHAETCLKSLTAQAQAMADQEWLQQQTARDVAILFGVMFDKTISLLAARQSTSGRNPAPEDPHG